MEALPDTMKTGIRVTVIEALAPSNAAVIVFVPILRGTVVCHDPVQTIKQQKPPQ
jgi:hypothetical protein